MNEQQIKEELEKTLANDSSNYSKILVELLPLLGQKI